MDVEVVFNKKSFFQRCPYLRLAFSQYSPIMTATAEADQTADSRKSSSNSTKTQARSPTTDDSNDYNGKKVGTSFLFRLVVK